MAYPLIVLSLILTVAGVRGTQNDLYGLVQGDFSGQNSFIYWLVAIAVIGGVGYIPGMRALSQWFLLLVLIVLVLSQNSNGRDLFGEFSRALGQTTRAPAPATGTNG